MYNDCSVTCMHNVVELCCMLSVVHDRRLCWHYTLQVLLTHHRSPLQRLEKACCLQKYLVYLATHNDNADLVNIFYK